MSILIKHMAMPKGCIYANDKDQTEYCPLLNHDDVPFCQYIENEPEIAIGIEERPVYCPLSDVPEPCQDAVSRQAAIAVADFTDYTGLPVEDVKKVTDEVVKGLKQLPSAQPTYTDEEIQKMQDLEQAQIEKAYQLGYEEGKKDAQSDHTADGDKMDCISRQAAISLTKVICILTKDGSEYRHRCIDPDDILDLPSAQPERRLCRECKWVKYHGNVDKRGNVESYWHCMNWDGGTDEEGYCYEWEGRCNQQTGGD